MMSYSSDTRLQVLEEDEIALVSLLCLFTAAQERCYTNYHEGFLKLEAWLLEDMETENFKFTERYAPDICAHCGLERQYTSGGRLRYYCPSCDEDIETSFSDRLLSYYNQAVLAEFMGQGQEHFEFYMSIAASFYRQYGSRKGLWKPKTKIK